MPQYGKQNFIITRWRSSQECERWEQQVIELIQSLWLPYINKYVIRKTGAGPSKLDILHHDTAWLLQLGPLPLVYHDRRWWRHFSVWKWHHVETGTAGRGCLLAPQCSLLRHRSKLCQSHVWHFNIQEIMKLAKWNQQNMPERFK